MSAVHGNWRVSARGLHSFRFQLNLSTSIHGEIQPNPECVLGLLKFSSKENECKPLVSADGATDDARVSRLLCLVCFLCPPRLVSMVFGVDDQ